LRPARGVIEAVTNANFDHVCTAGIQKLRDLRLRHRQKISGVFGVAALPRDRQLWRSLSPAGFTRNAACAAGPDRVRRGCLPP